MPLKNKSPHSGEHRAGIGTVAICLSTTTALAQPPFDGAGLRSEPIVTRFRLAAKMFVVTAAVVAVIEAFMCNGRRNPHHCRRRPVSGYPNPTRSIVAIDPCISRTRTSRPDHNGRRNADSDSNPDSRSGEHRCGEQAARQKHHRNHCFFHFLVLLTPIQNATPVPGRKNVKNQGFTFRYTG